MGKKGFWITSVLQTIPWFFCIMIAIWNENLCCDINFICRPSVTISTRKFSSRDPDTVHHTHTHIHTLRIFILYVLCAYGNCRTFQNILFGKWQLCCLRISFSSKCKRCIYTIRERKKKKRKLQWQDYFRLTLTFCHWKIFRESTKRYV